MIDCGEIKLDEMYSFIKDFKKVKAATTVLVVSRALTMLQRMNCESMVFV